MRRSCASPPATPSYSARMALLYCDALSGKFAPCTDPPPPPWAWLWPAPQPMELAAWVDTDGDDAAVPDGRGEEDAEPLRCGRGLLLLLPPPPPRLGGEGR